MLLLFGCTPTNDKNQIVQLWLEDNIETTDSYMLNIGHIAVYDEWEKEKPENIPVSISTQYEVHIFKNEKKAMIVNKRLGEKTFYLSIENDVVYIYTSTDNGFQKESYHDAKLAEKLAKIMFPHDVSVFDGDVVHTGTTDESSLGLKTFNVQRLVDSKPFPPDNLKQEEKNPLSFNFSYNMDADTMHSVTISRFGHSDTIDRFEDFFNSMYFIFNGFEYENIYTQNDIKFEQELTIYFGESGIRKAEDFELPK